ncbi:interleukin-1 receptor accessory protein-like 1-A isoform X2 [Carcharodon carcharias]|uniref:interleukin-1 receptor accessory protein-like 1-A isoform X2 n=1 Tax=Carcharodon carcharias TaxID=13397 RepID=UPI001B7E04D6|nr:interleukin-1 receptor accessory protein-like 1-A isoform X2 [Carcharodon carcharias]
MSTETFRNHQIGQEILWPSVMSLLMLLNGYVTAHISDDGAKDRDSGRYGAPKIILPASTSINAELGKSLELTCQAITGYSDKFSTIIYWLANQQFIEDVFEDSRVKEGREVFLAENGKMLIQKCLKFTKVTPEDFKTNFACAVMNPSGSSVKNITLAVEIGGFSTS